MSDPAGIPALQDAIRHLEGVESKHVETAHVHEKAPTGETVWEGDVEVFALVNHAKATKAYAWSEATEGGKRRFYVVLHATPVDSPASALRASFLADMQKAKAKKKAN